MAARDDQPSSIAGSGYSIVIPILHGGDAPVVSRIYPGARRRRWISSNSDGPSGESNERHLEMPGLSLNEPQARKLLELSRDLCEAALRGLARHGSLVETPNGTFRTLMPGANRARRGPASRPVRRGNDSSQRSDVIRPGTARCPLSASRLGAVARLQRTPRPAGATVATVFFRWLVPELPRTAEQS